jgi:hypothetical protein
MEWYEGQAFWIHLVILGVIVFLSLMFNYAYKRKTNPMFVFTTQVIIPLILMAAMEAAIFNWAFIVIDFFTTIGLYGIFNYSYFWYNQHRKFDDEKSVEHDFIGQSPDRDPFCRVYLPKFEATGKPAYKWFEEHYTMVRKFVNENLLKDIIDDFYIRNPNVARPALPSSTVPTEPPVDEVARKQWEVDQMKQMQQFEDAEKAVILQILKYTLEGWRLFILYYRWQWMVSPRALEGQDLHSDTKTYLLSTDEYLPPTLIINIIGFGNDEKEDNKTFTALFGIEGRRSPLLLERMSTLENNLMIFKIFQYIAYIERLERQITMLRIKSQNEVVDFEDVMKDKAVIDSRNARMLALRTKMLQKSILEKLKERTEMEV